MVARPDLRHMLLPQKPCLQPLGPPPCNEKTPRPTQKRVVFHSITGPFATAYVLAALLSVLLLAHVAAAFRGLTSLLEAGDGSDLLRLVASGLAFLLLEGLSIILVVFFSLLCTTVYVFLITSLYCTQGDIRASRRLQRRLPRVPLTRLVSTFILALALAFLIFNVSGVALLLLHYEVGLPLQLLGAAACLAGAAYASPLLHVACVASVLEDAAGFAAVRKSRALLAGKFWPAAAVFLTLRRCLSLLYLRWSLGDALGIGLGF
ncbi:hypothetical protein ZWY2020_059176 [Hordeum vulgare]|nr:hypothetical protein ZWY2020_059176 [Hordeum vulgare]